METILKTKINHKIKQVFPKEVVIFGTEIIKILKTGLIKKAELRIAEKGFEAVEEVKRNPLAREYFDALFTYIEVNIPENIREKLDERIQEIIFEGELLCYAEDKYGTDLKKLKRLSKAIIENKQ